MPRRGEVSTGFTRRAAWLRAHIFSVGGEGCSDTKPDKSVEIDRYPAGLDQRPFPWLNTMRTRSAVFLAPSFSMM